MSDVPKKLDWPKWLLPTFCTLGVFATYQGAHYATAAVVHHPGYCCPSCSHEIGGKEVPEWINDYFFWPAQKFDDMLGINPWGWR